MKRLFRLRSRLVAQDSERTKRSQIATERAKVADEA